MSEERRSSEFELIARYFAPLAATGAFGLLDDAAALTPTPGVDLVVTKDMLVAEVHFFQADPWDAVAKKALRVNLSDLAAKGARPVGFLLGLGLPKDWRESDLAAFAAGLADDVAAYRLPLLGGDTVTSPSGFTVSITALGEVATGCMVRRTTARAGDNLYVSGSIGDGALGLILRSSPERARELSSASRAALLDRYLLPRPRVALAPIVARYARAAMDISDGFLGDVAKMLAAAGVTVAVPLDRVPLSEAACEAIGQDAALLETALTGGDDYELLCAVSSDDSSAFEAAAGRVGVPVTRLAMLESGAEPARILGADSQPLRFARPSFAHF